MGPTTRAQPVGRRRYAHCSARSPRLESLAQKKTRRVTALTVSRNRGYPADGGVCGLFSCLLTVFSHVFSVFLFFSGVFSVFSVFSGVFSVFSSDDPGVFTLFSGLFPWLKDNRHISLPLSACPAI